ncbi:hypothetical protein LOTGIDRAFT_174312 [Lottia gigantea]|uniref:G-protein coupled receptors family 1 profile domain-containing protein n=1 Tax=Lottia gigantea TaxID=225164 RepID=V4AX51_LOTGI|nr:hypothetical protein LOTGIDRAFT_174312 [Lottia gigantea]ESO98136.1 hypothetical protein LOTGIDRAFT_174312 [Lottia gigantea]
MDNFTESGNVSENLNDSLSEYETVSQLASKIQRYYLWVIFAVGVPGNIATLITVLKMKPLTSLTAYVAVLSVVDLLAIFVKLSLLAFQVNSVDILNGGCKFMIFLGNLLVCFASWILVAMAVESVRRFRVKAMKWLTCRAYHENDKGVNLVIMRPSLRHRWSGNTDSTTRSVSAST